jgi:hypothetical protein
MPPCCLAWHLGGAVAVNGGKPKKFVLDTYATLDLSQEVAEEAGLRAVASLSGVVDNHPVTYI